MLWTTLLTSLHQTNRAETQCQFVGEKAVKKLSEQRLPALILLASTKVLLVCSDISQNSLHTPKIEREEKAMVRQCGRSKKKV